VEKLVPIPEILVYHPCKAVGAGTTVKSLSTGYIKNTSCIGKYEAVINGILNFNSTISREADGEIKNESDK